MKILDNPRNSIFIKKSLKMFFNIKRIYTNKNNNALGNPILCNSFPKSGTHLLFQILQNLPHKDWYNFIASIPSFPFRERTENKIINLLKKLVDKELVGTHIFYSKEIEEVIKKNNIVHYFIYRDPRDVVISEAFYLDKMNKWHALSKYYRSLNNLDEKIKFAILGNEFLQTKYYYPNVNDRFNRYKGWLDSDNTFVIKYEDLISIDKEKYIQQIINYYNIITHKELETKEYMVKIINNLDPKKSHTFREGGTNKWKKYFTNEHKEIFKEIAGNLLVELEYEKDLDW